MNSIDSDEYDDELAALIAQEPRRPRELTLGQALMLELKREGVSPSVFKTSKAMFVPEEGNVTLNLRGISSKDLKLTSVLHMNKLNKSTWNHTKALRMMDINPGDMAQNFQPTVDFDVNVVGPSLEMLSMRGLVYCGYLEKSNSRSLLKLWKERFFGMTEGWIFCYKVKKLLC